MEKFTNAFVSLGEFPLLLSQPTPETHLSRLIVLQLKFEHSLTLLFLYSNFHHAIRLRDNFHHVKPKKKWGKSVFLLSLSISLVKVQEQGMHL